MRQELLELHREWVGTDKEEASDTELLFDLVKSLLKRVQNCEDHTHSLR